MRKLIWATILFITSASAISANKVYSDKELIDLYTSAGGVEENLFKAPSEWVSNEFEDDPYYDDFGEEEESYYYEQECVDCPIDPETGTPLPIGYEVENDFPGNAEIPAETDDSAPKETSTIHRASDLARKLTEKIPVDALRDGLGTYIDIIGAENYGDEGSVGSSNAGVGAHHENVLSNNNECFATMVDEFYGDISKIDRSIQNDKRPSLLTESGKGKFDKLKPGWAWEMALEKAGGNPNLAMRLIGICGHDDVMQGNYQSKLDISDPSKKDAYIKSNLKLTLESHYNNYQKQEEIKSYMDAKKAIMSKDKVDLYISCPDNTSSFYLSNALGKDISIDDKMKERIIKTQGKDADPSNIASKNYHIMGAAYMACRLVEDGVHPALAAQIQKSAAWTYRTIRISDAIKKDGARGDKLNKIYDGYKKRSKNPLPREEFMWKYLNTAEKMSQAQDCYINETVMVDVEGQELSCSEGINIISELNLFDYSAGYAAGPVLSRKRLDRMLTKMDAAEIFDDRYIGGDKGIPHTNFLPSWNNDSGKITIPSYTTGGAPMTVRGYRKQPKGWSTERYKKALDRIETYLVDWDWTVKQHEIGAKFAAKNCKPTKYGDNIDEIACKVYEDPRTKCDPETVKTDRGLSSFMKSFNDVVTKFSDY